MITFALYFTQVSVATLYRIRCVYQYLSATQHVQQIGMGTGVCEHVTACMERVVDWLAVFVIQDTLEYTVMQVS